LFGNSDRFFETGSIRYRVYRECTVQPSVIETASQQISLTQEYEPGGWGAAAPDSDKAVIVRVKTKFFGQKPAAKIEKSTLFVFIKRKK